MLTGGLTLPLLPLLNLPGLPGLPPVNLPPLPGFPPLPGLPPVNLPGLPGLPGLPPSNFPTLVNFLAGAPTLLLNQAAVVQSGLLAGIVNGQLAFNQALVANEIALQQAIFGTNFALNGAVNHGFNAFNLLLGTGEQTINVLLGAEMPVGFTGSLLIGGPGTGGIPGILGQLVLLNGALGGDVSLLGPLGGLQAQLGGLVGSQLAFNQVLVANELALQAALFGTANTSPLNGALNIFSNMINFGVGTVQQTADVLLGVPIPAGFTAGLTLNGPADVFGAVDTGGLLGAVENKFLFDATLLSLLVSPIQLVLTGGLM